MAVELRHLRLVQTVAEEQSLTRAAKRLFLTQSALSHQLRSVEAHLRAPVFFRRNRKMELTPVGERLLRAAHVVEAELQRAGNEIRHLLAGKAGTIRLSTECYTCYHWLPSILKRFALAQPHVELQIDMEAADDPVGALLDGRLDLAIGVRPVEDQRLRVEPLFQDEFVAITSPGHSWTAPPFVTAQDFRDEHLITGPLPAEELTVFQQLLFPAGVEPRQVSRLQLTEGIIEFVRAGLGVGVLSHWMVRPYIEAGALAAIRLTEHGLHRTWYALMLSRPPTPQYLMELVSLIACSGPHPTSRQATADP